MFFLCVTNTKQIFVSSAIPSIPFSAWTRQSIIFISWYLNLLICKIYLNRLGKRKYPADKKQSKVKSKVLTKISHGIFKKKLWCLCIKDVSLFPHSVSASILRITHFVWTKNKRKTFWKIQQKFDNMYTTMCFRTVYKRRKFCE